VDQASFERLYTQTWRDILGYALRRTATEADAADIVAEVFGVAWRRRQDIPSGAGARLWLYGVARHALSNQRRGELRRGNLAAGLAAEAAIGGRDAAARDDPADIVAARAEAAGVLRALARLPEPERELLTLVAWDGLSPAQAAAVLGLPAGTARVRLYRARRRLRQLSENGPQRGPSGGHVLTGGLSPAPVGGRHETR
jgi:RNA polymerase sigma factor (sigma-70 family)